MASGRFSFTDCTVLGLHLSCIFMTAPEAPNHVSYLCNVHFRYLDNLANVIINEILPDFLL